MTGKQGSVPFHDPPPAETSYKNLIRQVKERGREKPGPLEGTPRFDALPPPRPERTELREETVEGLQALAKATEAEQRRREEAAATENEEDLPETPLSLPKSEEDQLREAIEKRCSKIDIGQYLMGGELLQEVVIIPGKLKVKFRTVTDLEEVYVDDALSNEEKLTSRKFIRRTNEWALATHVYTINDVKWPEIFDGDGTVSEKAITLRMVNVRKLSSPVFNLLISNLGWFLERVNRAMTMEALGNG